MSLLNIRLTSLPVKDKACIYNDLRLTPGIGCIAGMPQHNKGRKEAIAEFGGRRALWRYYARGLADSRDYLALWGPRSVPQN